MEEISQLGQVTCIPCSASEQKGLHFPESAPAGYFSQVHSDHFIASCSWPLVLTPQLVSKEPWLSSGLCSAAEIYYRTEWPLLTPSLSQLVSHSHWSAHTSCVHVCVGEREREHKRQTETDQTRGIFKIKKKQQYEERTLLQLCQSINGKIPEHPFSHANLYGHSSGSVNQNFKTPSMSECS